MNQQTSNVTPAAGDPALDATLKKQGVIMTGDDRPFGTPLSFLRQEFPEIPSFVYTPLFLALPQAGLTESSELNMLDLWYKSVNFINPTLKWCWMER